MNSKFTNDGRRSVNRNIREDVNSRPELVNRPRTNLSREEVLRRRRARARRLQRKRKKQRIVLAIIAVISLIVTWTIYMLLSFIWGLLVPSNEVNGVEQGLNEQGLNEQGLNEQVITELTYMDLPYARADYLERYNAYGEVNPSLSIEDIVTHTNMGIDVEFFTRDAIEVENSGAIDVLVNKVYSLSPDYAPSNLKIVETSRSTTLREEAAIAFLSMQSACKKLGFDVIAVSGYRAYSYQVMLYNNKVESTNEESADQYVSRPGHSEHATGLSVDVGINSTDINIVDESEYYPTLYEMLSDYGYIVRYPEGQENLTGYNYEPWHIRYLGVDLAKAVMESGLTYDEYVARLY